MIQKIKNSVMAIAALLAFGAPALVPTMAASAACANNITKNVAQGASDVSGGSANLCETTNVDNSSITKLAQTVVNIFSLVVGIVAVIMIIYGGFRYITSGGDSGRVGNAKNSLIYAIIGLVIVALAQLIVHFVLGQTSTIAQ